MVVRNCLYLNNIVEQDHQAIKRRCASMLGFKSFGNAAITFAGIELIHKRQFSFGPGRQRRTWSQAALGPGSRFSLKSKSEPPNGLLSRTASAPDPKSTNGMATKISG